MTGARHIVPLIALCIAHPALLHAQADDIRPVPSGPAVSLQQMQAACDATLVDRTAGDHRADPYNPAVAGAAAVLARIRPIFAAFAPNGFETRTGGTVFNPNYGMPANMQPWNFHVLAYPYSCLSSGRVDLNDHYAISAYITINDGLGHGPYTVPDDFSPEGYNSDDTMLGFHRLQHEWLVDDLPQARNGFFHISSDYQDIYWFTRGGQLPYSYVSREEFLRKQLSILQSALAHERSEMQRNYAAMGQPFDESVVATIYGPLYQKPIARYQDLLTQPTAWLQQPTLVHVNMSGEDYGYVFLDTMQPGEEVYVPVKPNPDYLDASKAAGEPQYIVIRLSNDQKRGEYFLLRDQIEQNIDMFKSLVN